MVSFCLFAFIYKIEKKKTFSFLKELQLECNKFNWRNFLSHLIQSLYLLADEWEETQGGWSLPQSRVVS